MRFNGEDMQCTYFSLQCRLLHINGKNENFTVILMSAFDQCTKYTHILNPTVTKLNNPESTR